MRTCPWLWTRGRGWGCFQGSRLVLVTSHHCAPKQGKYPCGSSLWLWGDFYLFLDFSAEGLAASDAQARGGPRGLMQPWRRRALHWACGVTSREPGAACRTAEKNLSLQRGIPPTPEAAPLCQRAWRAAPPCEKGVLGRTALGEGTWALLATADVRTLRWKDRLRSRTQAH